MSPRMEERVAPYKRPNGTGVTYPGSKHCVTDRKISESLTVTLLGYMKCRHGRLGSSPSNTRPALTETKGCSMCRHGQHILDILKKQIWVLSVLYLLSDHKIIGVIVVPQLVSCLTLMFVWF